MFEAARSAEVEWLFWIVCILFAAGTSAGFFGARVLPTFRVEHEWSKSWAMNVALTLALFGGLVVMLAAGWYLYPLSRSLVKGNNLDAVDATIWSGLSLSDPKLAGLNLQFSLTLHIDPLAALFLILVGFFTTCVAIYSFGWLAEDRQRHSVAGAFSLFAVTTMLVLVVNNAFWLLLALEMMSLSFGYLVLYRGKRGGSQEKSRTAIRTYLIISHLSIMCIGISILIIAITHKSFDLQTFRSHANNIAPLHRQLAFLLALIGLGIRAGITPFHFWVSIVHPQSPTTTHAFSLGVAIKIAIYLMLRFFFEFLGPISWWWGALILLLAGLTALVNVFYALLSHDLKQALAYHSVENIGIIAAGLGLALLASSTDFSDIPTARSVAGLALAASLFHTFNHAIFKGLLYLATGSIEKLTDIVKMSELGGLVSRFRWTSASFLIGAAAIAGFPPFNGFISEWLTLQAIFASFDLYQKTNLVPVLLLLLPLTLILLAISFAVTALAFVKIAGEALLGLPRTLEVAQAIERSEPNDVSRPMRLVLSILAILCLALGIMPCLLIPELVAATRGVGYTTTSLVTTYSSLTIQIGAGATEYTATLTMVPLVILAVVPIMSALTGLVWGVRNPSKPGSFWSGGETYQPQTMQYTGSSLSSLVWNPLVHSSDQPTPKGPLSTTFTPVVDRIVIERLNQLYNHMVIVLLRISTWLGNYLQGGDIRSYLLYIFVAFIVAILVTILLGYHTPR